MIITALVIGAAVAVGSSVAINEIKNKKYDESEIEKTDENTLQQFDENALSEEEKANFEENADMSVSDYQKIIAQMQEEIKSKKSEFNASKKGRGLLGTVGDGVKSFFGGGSKKVKNGIESAEEKLDALIAKGENVTLAEIQEVYKTIMGSDLDLAAIQSTLNSTDGSYTIQQVNADGTTSEVTYSKQDIVDKVQENAKKLQEKFDQTKSDQGIISKGLSFINNGLGIGTTSNEAQAKISAFIELAGTLSASDDDATFAAKFKSITGSELSEQAISNLMFDVDAYIAEYEANASVALTELEKEQIKDYFTMMGDSSANSAIMDYESTQESIKKGFNTIATTAIVIGAIAAAPFTGGASAIAVAGFGAAVGAGANVALNAADGLTSADGYSLSEAGMDALEGAVNGALAGAGGAVAGKAATATGKLAATKVGGKIVGTVGETVVSGAITGATYGAASSAANYTINTAVKNSVIEGDIVQNLGVEYIDEQGRNCIQYPVIDNNGDILRYETHVFDSAGNFVERFSSNDFSLGGLVSNTVGGAVTGAVAGGIAGKAGFKLGQTEGTTASRLVAGTEMGAIAGAGGGAASGVSSWAQSGFEGGATGLVDSVVDGTLEGTVTGATAGFAVTGGQIVGENLSPKVLKHIEENYEKAQQRKLAVDNNAEKASSDDVDGADEIKTKAQQRADKRVEKYKELYEIQNEKVRSYGFNEEADAVANAKADFDIDLQTGDVEPLETFTDKAQAAGDKAVAKAKTKGAELGQKAKEMYETRKANAENKQPIGERVKNGYNSAKASSKEAWNTIKSEKGFWNKVKASYNIGKNAAANASSKIFNKFTNSTNSTASYETATDTTSNTATQANSSTVSQAEIYSSSTSLQLPASSNLSANAIKTLETISGFNNSLALKLANANVSETSLMQIEQILMTNYNKPINMVDVDTITGSVSFTLGASQCEVIDGRVIIDGIDATGDIITRCRRT